VSKAQLHDSPVVSLSDLWPEGQIQTLSGRIIDHIRSALFSGHLTSGAFLGTEASWAEQFGVSRMASRDAINALKAAGIIEIRIGARGGIFVAEANPDRFAEALAIQMKLIGVEHAEVLDAQIAIEVTATELAAQRANTEDLMILNELLEQMRQQTDQPNAFTQLSMQFRESLIAASKNRVLIAQFRGLRHLLLPHYTRHTTREVAERAIFAHEALLTFIAARDSAGASQLMRERLYLIREVQLNQKGPER
jgi:DNA-binding FadR family transcriptional regulator